MGSTTAWPPLSCPLSQRIFCPNLVAVRVPAPLAPGLEGRLSARGQGELAGQGPVLFLPPAVVFTPCGRDGKEAASQLLWPLIWGP